MKFGNKTKIIATIGPASSSKEVLREMILEGVNVCRINFSHGTHEDHLQVIRHVRDLNDELQSDTAILADLQGPKLRIGKVEKDTVLVENSTLTITIDECLGTAEKICTNYVNFAKDINEGESVLIDDGKIVLKVLSTDKKKEVKVKVIQGGDLTSNKGLNLPFSKVSLPSLTEKDLEDLDFAIEQQLSWIGLSFVRSPQDIIELKTIIREKKGVSKVVAKIEKPEAVEEIDAIIEETDAVMVARGDLGVEIPMQDVPILQKKIIKKCQTQAKPVIIATQMMESMIESLSPTRAEVNDVAIAVMDGADAVMLSGETSVGRYPVAVIKAMYKIIIKSETFEGIYHIEHLEHLPKPDSDRFINDLICFNASRLAQTANAKAILTMTFSGYTAFKVASYRPKAGIYVFTSNQKLLNMLSLTWGVRAFYYDKFVSTDHTIADIKFKLRKNGVLHEDDMVINIASMPIAGKGKSNMLKLSYAKES